MFQNVLQAMDFIRQNSIEFVDFKVTDLHGRWKHLTIPAQRFNESIMEHGIGFDGSNYGYAMVENSDMVFLPDLSTAVVDPFVQSPTLATIGDVMVIGRDGEPNRPFGQYPRNVAKRATAYMKELGIADEMIVGPEYEFHIFDKVSCSVQPNTVSYALQCRESAWGSGDFGSGFYNRPHDGYHADAPADAWFQLRNEMCKALAQWGVDVKYHHHEVGGSGQVEIETELGEMTKMADATMAAKYVIRNTAAASGATATFLPKPIYGEAGNGMHIHMLLRKNGQPVFYDENNYGGLSQTAMYFMGGLLKHVRALCAFCNPTTNSYKRLVPGFEAPVTVGYAMANRSAVVRIPAYVKEPGKKRFELRNPDATCNPYYAMAAILMAGLDGVKNRIDPKDHFWGPFDRNLFDLPEEEKQHLEVLPGTLEEAVQALREDHDFLLAGDVFPEALVQTWIRTISQEAAAINRIPHPAEIYQYYDL